MVLGRLPADGNYAEGRNILTMEDATMSMTYKEWRKRTAAESLEKLLKRAYRLLQEWNSLEHSQAVDIERQLSGECIKDDECWMESLPGATINFVNWGI